MPWTREHWATVTATVSVDRVMGAERPRFNRYSGAAYNTPAYKAYLKALREAFEPQMLAGMDGWTDEAEVRIAYSRRYPESAADYREFEPDLGKPDADNVAKAILDALTQAGAWHDDSQVTLVECRANPRRRIPQERIEVRIDYWANTASK